MRKKCRVLKHRFFFSNAFAAAPEAPNIPLFLQEIGKFGLEINVIPNGLEKCMSFMLGKHLVFIDSKQFMIFGPGSSVNLVCIIVTCNCT